MKHKKYHYLNIDFDKTQNPIIICKIIENALNSRIIKFLSIKKPIKINIRILNDRN